MDDTTESQKPRTRHRLVDDESGLQTLVNSLTLDQLRFSLLRLAPRKRISLRSHKDAFDALLQTGCSEDQIILDLLSTEASSPAKHCFICHCSNFDGLLSGKAHRGTTFVGGSISFRVAYTQNSEHVATTTFEHLVQVKTWEETSPGLRRLKLYTIRHPIVLRLLKQSGSAMFLYPGYSNADPESIGDRGGYEALLSSLVTGLAVLAGISFKAMPFEKAIRTLSEGANDRVRIVSSDVEASIVGDDALASFEDVLSRFVGPYLGDVSQVELRKAIASAFRAAPANSLVVHWVKEAVVSRIQFWRSGAELFFVWHNSKQSLYLIDQIANLLFELSGQLQSDSGLSVWQQLARIPPNQIVLPANFAGENALSIDAATSIFVKAVSAGLLQPVYRLKTNEDLVDFINEWTPILSRLRRRFRTQSGFELNGGNPESIEVAFERVGERKVEQ